MQLASVTPPAFPNAAQFLARVESAESATRSAASCITNTSDIAINMSRDSVERALSELSYAPTSGVPADALSHARDAVRMLESARSALSSLSSTPAANRGTGHMSIMFGLQSTSWKVNDAVKAAKAVLA